MKYSIPFITKNGETFMLATRDGRTPITKYRNGEKFYSAISVDSWQCAPRLVRASWGR
jgi:hypothetical protein